MLNVLSEHSFNNKKTSMNNVTSSCSGVFTVNFEKRFTTGCSNVSVIDIEQVHID